MKKISFSSLRLLLTAIAFTSFSLSAKAQFSIVPDQTAADLLQAMTGQNVVISNETLTCMDTANALFNFTGSALGISDGIILYTGRVDDISNPWNFTLSHQNNTPGDANVTATVGFGTFDACALEFDVVPAYDTLFLRYLIGSDEYPTYSCSYFGDHLGFFINGGGYTDSNFAQFPDTNIYVTGARIACPMDTFAYQYYVDNYLQQSPDIAFNGYSLPIESSIVVTPGVSYHIKIALADVSDMAFDSGLLIEGGSLGSKNALAVPKTVNEKNKATVFPNPFSSYINMKMDEGLNKKEIQVNINDILGRAIYSYSGKGSGLNEDLKKTTNLNPGIYFMSIVSGEYREVLKLQKI